MSSESINKSNSSNESDQSKSNRKKEDDNKSDINFPSCPRCKFEHLIFVKINDKENDNIVYPICPFCKYGNIIQLSKREETTCDILRCDCGWPRLHYPNGEPILACAECFK